MQLEYDAGGHSMRSDVFYEEFWIHGQYILAGCLYNFWSWPL